MDDMDIIIKVECSFTKLYVASLKFTALSGKEIEVVGSRGYGDRVEEVDLGRD